jgi:hypothetical protein
MQVEERSHRFTDQILNACILTIGLYIATLPVAPFTSKGMERSMEAAKQLQSMSPSVPRRLGQSTHPTTYQSASNRTCIQTILHTLNTLIFHQNG